MTTILLAAGLSQRMGEDKLLLSFHGKSLLQNAVDLLSNLPVYKRILVTTDARSKQIVLPPGIQLCINSNPHIGQSESIRLGIERTQGDSSDMMKEAYLFLNADQPHLTVDDILQLLTIANNNQDMIIFPVIDEKPCSPTIFPSCYRVQLLNLSGDDGGRVIRNANREHCIAVTPNTPGNFTDVDNKEDYNDLINS